MFVSSRHLATWHKLNEAKTLEEHYVRLFVRVTQAMTPFVLNAPRAFAGLCTALATKGVSLHMVHLCGVFLYLNDF